MKKITREFWLEVTKILSIVVITAGFLHSANGISEFNGLIFTLVGIFMLWFVFQNSKNSKKRKA